MPTPQLLADLEAICERNRAEKQAEIENLARTGRTLLSYPKPLTASQKSALRDMIECLIVQRRLFLQFEDEQEVKLVELFAFSEENSPTTTTNRSNA